jgi:hypothetical protein
MHQLSFPFPCLKLHGMASYVYRQLYKDRQKYLIWMESSHCVWIKILICVYIYIYIYNTSIPSNTTKCAQPFCKNSLLLDSAWRWLYKSKHVAVNRILNFSCVWRNWCIMYNNNNKWEVFKLSSLLCYIQKKQKRNIRSS